MSRQHWFADLALVTASLGSGAAGLLVFRTAQVYHVGLLRQVLFVGGLMFLGIVFLACLRLPLEFRVTLAMTLLSIAVAAYGAEAYIRELPRLRVRWAARRFGIPYDARSQIEVVRDLRAEEKDAWPAAFPAWEGLPAEQEGLLPLGGISTATTVFCNEMGQYVVYFSDEHGFHNPQGIWSSPRLDLAVLGDSFVQGACVPSEQNFVALLRAEHPATLNLGMVGNGPLLELAGLREFLVDLKPGTVLWVFTEGNDVPFDLDREKGFPLLTAYLQPGHRQGLQGRQAEIDRLLRRLIDREYIARQRATIAPEVPSRFLQLWSLRQALGLHVGDPGMNGALVDLSLFRRILQEAQVATQSWGGRFIFVYLPAEARYFDAGYRRGYDRLREQVLGVLLDLRIPFIDLHPPIVRHPNIAELYAQRGKHFSPAGNRLVAETILGALRSRAGN